VRARRRRRRDDDDDDDDDDERRATASARATHSRRDAGTIAMALGDRMDWATPSRA
jgi:hypothetical protein